jgi:hypothetical protein
MAVESTKNMVKNEYSGVNSTNIVSMVFNFAFMKVGQVYLLLG